MERVEKEIRCQYCNSSDNVCIVEKNNSKYTLRTYICKDCYNRMKIGTVIDLLCKENIENE